ncbi:unnamed protein product [Miscanthus lutarioriparius]|uniref:Uncharacterized protein n=1 Tax=Miscanthus lutarioriparius TaxID=422564 RepID=A0A811PY72_9POAL|nr:unnamed protein product [Miscanthus lutarioriparius]
MDQEAKGESEESQDVVIVQANPSARQGAAGGKQSLEADVTIGSGAVPKRPRRACTLRPATAHEAVEEQPDEVEEDTSFSVRQ